MVQMPNLALFEKKRITVYSWFHFSFLATQNVSFQLSEPSLNTSGRHGLDVATIWFGKNRRKKSFNV
jgi:hypothetical protein